MNLSFFIQGIALGLTIAAPVGPVGLLCMKRSLEYGRWSGLFSGLGATAADVLYGLMAILGLAFILEWLVAFQTSICFFGGLFMIFIGSKTYFSKPLDADQFSKPAKHKNLVKDFFSTFFLTLTNPMTLLSFLAIFASFGPVDAQSTLLGKIELLLGIFIGSALWWILLAEGITSFRHLVSRSLMKGINHFAGLLLIGFGSLVWFKLYLNTRVNL